MTEGWKSHNHQARMLLNGTVQSTDCHHHIVASPHPNPPARSHRGRHRVPYYEQLRPLVPNVTLALKYLIHSPLGDDTNRYSNQPGPPVSKGKPTPTCYPIACLP